jgi:hypothetical protein
LYEIPDIASILELFITYVTYLEITVIPLLSRIFDLAIFPFSIENKKLLKNEK